MIVFCQAASFVACWGRSDVFIIVIIVVVDHLDNNDIVFWIAVSMSWEAIQRDGAMRLVSKTDNSIASHGIEDAPLLVELELKMVVRVDVQIDASNHTGIECPARKARPPVSRDLHTKAPE